MAIVNLCTGTAAAAALLESLIIGKLGAVVYGDRLKHFSKQARSVCQLDTVKGFYNARGGVVFHYADKLVTGVPLCKHEKCFLCAFLAYDAIHFPMTERATLRDLRGAFFDTVAFGSSCGTHFIIFPLGLVALYGQVLICDREENALLNVAVINFG